MTLKDKVKKIVPSPMRKYIRRVQALRHLRIVDDRELYALPEQDHLRRLLPFLQVDCIFDVGAHSGQHGEMLRKRVGYKGRIISFEPNPALAETVRRVAADDDLWTVEEIALDEEGGEAYFNVMKDTQFSSLGTPDEKKVGQYRNSNTPTQRIKVQKETLEQAFRRLKAQYGFVRPFLKMDTQGFDVRVLRGGREVASEFVGLQSELAVLKLYQEAADYRDALSFYESQGFELSAIVPNNAGQFPRLVEMDCIMINKAAAGLTGL